MYFSSKQESGLNLYLSKYQELSSGCRLHIARVITCVCARDGKALGSREAEPFPVSQPFCLSLCLPSSILWAPGKGKSGNRPPQEAVLLWSPEIPGNKTEALGSNKQQAVSVDFYPLRMIILTASKRLVYILIRATVAGIMPLPQQWAYGEAVPFSKVCGDKEKTCIRHVLGSQPILLPTW